MQRFVKKAGSYIPKLLLTPPQSLSIVNVVISGNSCMVQIHSTNKRQKEGGQHCLRPASTRILYTPQIEGQIWSIAVSVYLRTKPLQYMSSCNILPVYGYIV